MKHLYFLILVCLPLKDVWGQKNLKVTDLQLDRFSQNHIEEKVKKFAAFKIDRDIFKSGSIASAAQFQLNIPNFKNFSFSLGKTKVKSSDYSQSYNGNRNGAKPTAETYGGYLENGKYVRLTIAPGFIYGIIEADKGFYVIDQLKYFLQDKNIEENNLIMYHTSEIYDQKGLCGLSMDNNSNSKEMEQDDISTASYDADCLILEIATDADYEYYQAFGSNTNNRILGDINNIQPVYEDSFGMELTVVFQNVWDNINDPYHVTDPPQDVNDEIDVVWQNNFSHVKRDVIHLFTGKTFYIFGGEVRGSADGNGTICQRETANSFTTNTYQSFGVVAHELGHNLGALHGDADCDTSKSVMCQGLKSTPLYFSNNSIARIENYISSNSVCLGKPEPMTVSVYRPNNYSIDATVYGGSGETPYYWYLNNQYSHSTTLRTTSFSYTQSSVRIEVRNDNICGTGQNSGYFTGYISGSYSYSVSPNPSSSEVNITSKNKNLVSDNTQQRSGFPTKPDSAQLYDFNGAFVKDIRLDPSGTTKLDISSLKEGFYFLKVIVGEEEVETYKVIVRR